MKFHALEQTRTHTVRPRVTAKSCSTHLEFTIVIVITVAES